VSSPLFSPPQDPNTRTAMFESSAIIKYIEDTYAA
jgi:glutathione S-transferase